jgi:steroid 5-alpha reductase family enzyme
MELSVANPWILLALGWLLMAAIMAVLWAYQKRTRNAGFVDVCWACGVGILAVVFAALADGNPARRLLIAICAGIWGLRLGGYLLRRVRNEAEDGRYQALRRQWGERTQALMFGFFQVQAFWAVLFATPMLIAAANPTPLGWLDGLAVAIWAVALGGEALADRQLARFRARPDSRGLPRGPVALQPSPQLLLRVGPLVGLRRLCPGRTLGLAHAGLAGADAVVPAEGDRRPAHRGERHCLAG